MSEEKLVCKILRVNITLKQILHRLLVKAQRWYDSFSLEIIFIILIGLPVYMLFGNFCLK